jgi:hypothetical protein
LVCVALATGFWAAATFPIFWSQRKIDKIGARIAAGELFKRLPLEEVLPQLDQLEQQRIPRPQSLHNAALIELRLAELELGSGEKIAGNSQFARAQTAIETALRAVPSDAFMWFALFWLVKTRDGMSAEALPYLRMSYLVGPHEGWVAARRNRIAIPLLSVLPKDLADLVTVEFENLVSYGYVDTAADILTGPGWGNHELLLQGLTKSPEYARRNLADAVYALGFDVTVPGVERRGQRPWK